MARPFEFWNGKTVRVRARYASRRLWLFNEVFVEVENRIVFRTSVPVTPRTIKFQFDDEGRETVGLLDSPKGFASGWSWTYRLTLADDLLGEQRVPVRGVLAHIVAFVLGIVFIGLAIVIGCTIVAQL